MRDVRKEINESEQDLRTHNREWGNSAVQSLHYRAYSKLSDPVLKGLVPL